MYALTLKMRSTLLGFLFGAGLAVPTAALSNPESPLTPGVTQPVDAVAQKTKKKPRKKRPKAKNKKSKKKSQSPADPSPSASATPPAAEPATWLKLMPLGIAQFSSGSPLLGAVFAGGQVGGFLLGIMQLSQGNAIQAEADTYWLEAQAALEELRTTDQAEAGQKQEEANQQLDAYASDIAAADQMATLGFVLAGASYALGVLHAFLATPEPARVAADHRANPYRSLYSRDAEHKVTADGVWQMTAPSARWHQAQLIALPQDAHRTSWTLHLGVEL